MDKAVTDTIQGIDGIRRLMICMPPRHGKSSYASQYFPSWFLGTFPDKRVILTSYEASFAATWGRKARNLLEEHGGLFGVRVASSPSAADQWDIEGNTGGMVTAGVGGPITGRGADCAIIDDALKNFEEASSQLIRDKIWDWWQSTLYTRLEPNAVVVMVMTRWHEDDLCGRIIASVKSGESERWRMLRLPAINSQNLALWPERYSLKDLHQIRRSVGPHHWEALYQQNPTAREGSFFKVNKFNYAPSEPIGLRTVRAWDLAATEGDGDYTAGVRIGIDNEGRVYVCHVQRGQWATDERDRWLKSTAVEDGYGTMIHLAEDPGQASKSQMLTLSRLLNGFSVKSLRVTGKKTTRADSFSSQVNMGNVWLVKGSWNGPYIEELRQFDKGKNDDQIDASADAYNELTQTTNQYYVATGGDRDDREIEHHPYGGMVEKDDDLEETPPPKIDKPVSYPYHVGGTDRVY
jgi:predicted phage terminase large subunit-like protein